MEVNDFETVLIDVTFYLYNFQKLVLNALNKGKTEYTVDLVIFAIREGNKFANLKISRKSLLRALHIIEIDNSRILDFVTKYQNHKFARIETRKNY